jgi:hypothetical protein
LRDGLEKIKQEKQKKTPGGPKSPSANDSNPGLKFTTTNKQQVDII